MGFLLAGFPDLMVEEWFSSYVPAKTPASIIAAANTAINAALREKSVIDRLAIQFCVTSECTAYFNTNIRFATQIFYLSLSLRNNPGPGRLN